MPETLTAPFTTLSHPNIAAPKGFHADGQHVGLKHKAKDLGWLISDVPAAVVVCMCLAWITPICPVTALALPELTIIACSWPF